MSDWSSQSQRKGGKNEEKEKDKKKESIEKESKLEPMPTPMNKDEILALFEKESSICLIKYQIESSNDISTGTWFFCDLDFKEIPFKKAIFTNNHVLNQNSIQIGQKIILENLKKTIEITSERKAFTNEELDYTCIEILEEDGIENFFKIDKSIFNNKSLLIKKEICVLQYLKEKLSFSSGKIMDIKDNCINHSTPTDKGSSGSPIIRRQLNNNFNEIVGIHYGGGKDANSGNKATPFDEIIKDLKNKINFIVAIITIDEDNFETKILNSFENAKKEGFTYEESTKNQKKYPNNEDQIKNCQIIINNKKVPSNYYHKFDKKGDYKIVYKFNKLLTLTNCMFYECECIKELDLSYFKTKEVTNMFGMFSGCRR